MLICNWCWCFKFESKKKTKKNPQNTPPFCYFVLKKDLQISLGKQNYVINDVCIFTWKELNVFGLIRIGLGDHKQMKHIFPTTKYWVTTNVLKKNFIFLRVHTKCYVNTVSIIFHVKTLLLLLQILMYYK